jgi:hypothetical protein
MACIFIEEIRGAFNPGVFNTRYLHSTTQFQPLAHQLNWTPPPVPPWVYRIRCLSPSISSTYHTFSLPFQLIFPPVVPRNRSLPSLSRGRPLIHFVYLSASRTLPSPTSEDAMQWFARTRTGARAKVVQGVSQPSQQR